MNTNTIKTNTIAIIGAMLEEIKILTEQMQSVTITEIAGVKMYAGTLNNTPVVVVQSGIGKVNATIATTLVIEHFAPQYVINTGSAGGIGGDIHPQLAVGDIVIGTAIAHHDVDVTAFGYHIGQMAQMPIDYPCDEYLIAVAQKNSETSTHISSQTTSRTNVYQGQIVSGDQFIASAEHFLTIKKNFPCAVAVEMEACAIAQTCYRFNVPFIIIRAISDLANEKATISFLHTQHTNVCEEA